jgi:hypothetical protein
MTPQCIKEVYHSGLWKPLSSKDLEPERALMVYLAERVGFEPTVPRKGDNRFRVCPDRPLWHLSCQWLSYMEPNPTICRYRPRVAPIWLEGGPLLATNP